MLAADAGRTIDSNANGCEWLRIDSNGEGYLRAGEDGAR